MKNLTLQWRIALLTALILAVSSIALTAAAMVNAEHSFMALMEETFSMPPEDAVPTEPYPEGTVVAGGAAEQAQVAKRGFDLRSVLSCVIITALGSVVAYYVAGKALAPLRKLSESVATIDEHTLSQRLPAATAKDEVGALTEGFNGMLTRLDDAFLRQKRFTANAAHELKTPLATMKTGAQVLSADESATLTDYQEHAKSTLMTVDRMAAVVDDLLLLASAGENMVHEQEEVLLDALFEAIQSELALSLERRDMRCTVHCGDLSVAGDASMLYRAFFNLVENACKYGRQGGHIQITAQKVDAEIAVSVEDDGPGIAPEHLPYIFDAFYRADKSRSREMGGSGLGLSIAKSMIEASGGRIIADSDGISGSRFTVTLPAFSAN